jgi:hypothetical protein
MKARAHKKMLKRVAKQQAASQAAHKIVDTITPSKKTRAETMQTIASGAASLASLLGGVWAAANSDIARELLKDVKAFRRRNDFGNSAGTWIAVGAGAAAVATGVAFFLGTQSGQRIREQVTAIAKPYYDLAVKKTHDLDAEITEKTTNGVISNTSSAVS